MNAGGITSRLLDLSKCLVGHIRGGLSHVNIVSSMVFSGVSGSSAADVSAIGSILIPAMKKEGYPPGYAAAVTAASSVIGPIIPPSIPIVVYGLIAQVSIGKLFVAGVMPGIFMGIYLLIASTIISFKRNYPKSQRCTSREIYSACIAASLAMPMPIIILGGITTGIVTATEAGAVAVVYSLIVGLFFYRELKPSALYQMLYRTMVNCSAILIIIATTGLFSWLVANMAIGDSIVFFFRSISDNKWVILTIIMIFFLIWGLVLDPVTASLIMVPIFLPLVNDLGIDLVHFGIIVVMNVMIGNVTPPMGIMLFLSSSISKSPIENVIRETIPFLIALILCLAMCIYIPDIVLWLPDLLLE